MNKNQKLNRSLKKQIEKLLGSIYRLNDRGCGYYWISGLNKNHSDYSTVGFCNYADEYRKLQSDMIVDLSDFTVVFRRKEEF